MSVLNNLTEIMQKKHVSSKADGGKAEHYHLAWLAQLAYRLLQVS